MKKIMINLGLLIAGSGTAFAMPCDTLRESLSTRTLTAGKAYILEGMVRVTNGQTLTIDPDVTVCALPGSGLLIEKGARIYANGIAGSPITFTSAQPAGMQAPGDWTGIVIIGDAGNNKPLDLLQKGSYTYLYGGTDDTYNAGSMRYVNIEYAGQATAGTTHPAALVVAATGTSTIMDYIQVLESGSDGIRLLGGTSNLKNIYIQNAYQNDIRIAYGYKGTISELLTVKNKAMRNFDTQSKGISVINNESNPMATPLTSPVISSFTLMGPQHCGSQQGDRSNGLFFDHNSSGTYENGVISGFDINLVIADNGSAANAAATLSIQYISLGNAGSLSSDFWGSTWAPCGTDIHNWLQTDPCGTSGNVQYTQAVLDYHPGLCEDFCNAAPVFSLGQATTLRKRADLESYVGVLQYGTPAFSWVNSCPELTCCQNTTSSTQPLELYPNPAYYAVSLRIPAIASTAQVKVFNIHTGELMYQSNTSSSTLTLDISQYPAGNYLIQVHTTDELYQGILHKVY